jgi:hypothetical protein
MFSSGRLCALSVGFTLVFSSATTHAQGRAEDRLAKVKGVKCTFPIMATGTWTKGEPQRETKPAKLSVGFDEVNVDDGTARVIGAFGPSDIIVRLAFGTLHFMQSFREGPIYITTIFPEETRGGSLQAVHTRHEFTKVSLPGFTSRPEQYLGECVVE